ncbi:hypothetical protein E6O75_ATG10276 [Venturia nashicola]|uniref:Uncharacterized protein n=1 Tax=Venturia nashicola TaxID=86259 RepID=A0A4Z1NCT8_9PEZI|nr:hypothetical protein E6O75_ATG10276 [Venturia nashicola]
MLHGNLKNSLNHDTPNKTRRHIPKQSYTPILLARKSNPMRGENLQVSFAIRHRSVCSYSANQPDGALKSQQQPAQRHPTHNAIGE